jgi:hypothetical protein
MMFHLCTNHFTFNWLSLTQRVQKQST